MYQLRSRTLVTVVGDKVHVGDLISYYFNKLETFKKCVSASYHQPVWPFGVVKTRKI